MKHLLTGALALSMLASTAAIAQPDRHDNHNDHGGYSQDGDHGDRHDNRGHRDDRADRDHDNGRGHHWGRGQRLPREYYQDRSHDVDYRRHHLRAPPRGYRWVQTDDNYYALVGTNTGLIAALIAATR